MSDERLRVRLKWRYKDKTGTYEEPEGLGSAWMDGKHVNFFMWEEGNWSCDCNKSNFFGLAPEGDFWECGDEIEVYDLEVIE